MIRPGYLSFVRLLNVIFGFNKIDPKYNEEFVMRNVNTTSLKEILLTFKNPRIQEILSNYSVTHNENKYNHNNVITLSFEKFKTELMWYHATIEINGIHQDNADVEGCIRLLGGRDSLRYWIDDYLTQDNLVRIDEEPHEMLLYNPDILRKQIELTINFLFKNGKPISDTLINVYKTIWAPEQTHLVLTELPPIDYFDSPQSIENYNLFNAFEGKIKLSKDILKSLPACAIAGPISLSLMNIIIKLNGINNELDNYGNKIIHFFFYFSDFDILFKNALNAGADCTLCDLFGNNIIHLCTHSSDPDYTVKKIKEIIDKETGNNQAFNKLLTTKNKSGYYPVISLLKRTNYIGSVLFPENKNDLFDVFINGVTKLFLNSFKKFNKFFEDLTTTMFNNIKSDETYKSLLINMFRFIISLGFKNKIIVDTYINIYKKLIVVEHDEINYLNNIRCYQMNEKYTLELNKDQIISTLKISKYYDINPWILFNEIDTKITWNNIFNILQENNLLSEFSKIGQIEDIIVSNLDLSIKKIVTINPFKKLITNIINWASKEKNFETIIYNTDSDGNTLYHYLAISSRINLDISSQYINLFNNSIINKNKFELLIQKNNKGWTPIDILSYIPNYTFNIFSENLVGIIDLFKILINFYTKFTENISDHKIILTRYLIHNYYVNIKQTKVIVGKETTNNFNIKEVCELITLLNLTVTPKNTYDMLNLTYIKFNLHEYLTEFGSYIGSNKANVNIHKTRYRNKNPDYIQTKNDSEFSISDKRAKTKFDLSNKSTLKYIPGDEIFCIPKLKQNQNFKLGAPNEFKRNPDLLNKHKDLKSGFISISLTPLIIPDIKSFISKQDFNSADPNEVSIDPYIEKEEEVWQQSCANSKLDLSTITDPPDPTDPTDATSELELPTLTDPPDTATDTYANIELELPTDSIEIVNDGVRTATIISPLIDKESPSTIHNRIKYLIHDENYAKLYLKYKQKYINLKNKLANSN